MRPMIPPSSTSSTPAALASEASCASRVSRARISTKAFGRSLGLLGASGLLVAACSEPPDDSSSSSGRKDLITATDTETSAAIKDQLDQAAAASADGVTKDVTNEDGSTSQVVVPDEIVTVPDEGMMISTMVGDECGANSVPTAIKEVSLSFVFDVSASMGVDSSPQYSRDQKWEPVVAATKAFFSDPASDGMSASLTFFPNEQAPFFADNGGGTLPAEACDSAYYPPVVDFTALPSAAFETAILAVTPADDNSDWRYGTPTLAALEGTYDTIRAIQEANGGTQYSVVLVTDGEPAACDNNANNINTVAAAVRAAADDNIATYVIGVESPADDNTFGGGGGLNNLQALSEAGGTDLFLVDTADPEQTRVDFLETVSAIREASFSCQIPLPSSDGTEEFDQDKVNVEFEDSDGNKVPYVKDQDCLVDGSWRFDDATNPTAIELCPSVCDSLKAGAIEGQLGIQLGCPTIVGPIQ